MNICHQNNNVYEHCRFTHIEKMIQCQEVRMRILMSFQIRNEVIDFRRSQKTSLMMNSCQNTGCVSILCPEKNGDIIYITGLLRDQHTMYCYPPNMIADAVQYISFQSEIQIEQVYCDWWYCYSTKNDIEYSCIQSCQCTTKQH